MVNEQNCTCQESYIKLVYARKRWEEASHSAFEDARWKDYRDAETKYNEEKNKCPVHGKDSG